MAAAVDAFGRIDIVVNNAGLARGGGAIETITEDELQTSLAVNFVGHDRHDAGRLAASGGATLGAHREHRVRGRPRHRDRGRGRIAYGAAKAAVWSFTITLARQGLEHGITVNAVSPGAATRMNEAMFEAAPPPAGLDLDPCTSPGWWRGS